MKTFKVPEWHHTFIYNHPKGNITVHLTMDNAQNLIVATMPKESWTRIPSMLKSEQFNKEAMKAAQFYKSFLELNGLNPDELARKRERIDKTSFAPDGSYKLKS